MGYRNARQPRIALVTVVVKLPIQNLLRGRPAQGLVRFIHRRQQFAISGCITIHESIALVRTFLHSAGILVWLSSRVTCDRLNPVILAM